MLKGMMILIAIGIATFVSTFLGGLFALKFKDRLHLILAFSAGAVVGVAFFDLIPEAMEIGTRFHSFPFMTSIIALGFIIYMVLDRTLTLHFHPDEHGHSQRSTLGATSLAIHSLLDGIGIGFAFQVSSAVGVTVAAAVLAHDFSDGINTVSLIFKGKGENKEALRWLIIDAVAPVVGIASTLLFGLPESLLGLVLALFAGFFLYIGASDLLPESHHNHPTYWTTIASIFGVLVLYLAVTLAGI
jgi:zinc transporter ZupT